MADEVDILTDARLSVWQAIDEWEQTKRLFKKTIRLEGESTLAAGMSPGFADLDCLLIMPTATLPKWLVTTQRTLYQSLALVMWTKDWNLKTAEQNVIKLTNAIYRAKTVENVPYVRDPKFGPGADYKLTKINPDNEILCIKTTLQVVVPVMYQPYQ